MSSLSSQITNTNTQLSAFNTQLTNTNTSLSLYAPIQSPTFTGGPRVFTNNGRYIEFGVDASNCCYIDFHSCESNTTSVDYDRRIISSGGNDAGGGGMYMLDYFATYHNFHGTMYFNGNLVATTD